MVPKPSLSLELLRLERGMTDLLFFGSSMDSLDFGQCTQELRQEVRQL